MEADIDDTHLCIKCNETIGGLENYIEHRKSANCSRKTVRVNSEITHPYGPFDYPGTPTYIKTGGVGKTPKSLTDAYDLPYDLGADVFFSSLELQSSSKRSTNPSATPSSVGGKSSSNRIQTRKATASMSSNHEPDDEWIPASTSNNSESLMKAVRDISGNKKFDPVFKLLPFSAKSPEQTDDDESDVDEDFSPSVKWKSDTCNVTRPIFPKSPMWDARHQWDINAPVEFDLTPPPSHTRGKWVPGTKTYKLSYKDDAVCKKIIKPLQWCNTCNRGLATKLLYEKHLQTKLHRTRMAPEQLLERSCLNMGPLSKHYASIIEKPPESIKKSTQLLMSLKRKRTKTVYRCEICRTRIRKHLIGKHLISHFHYRKMTLNPSKPYNMILENMHPIVFESPFQCKPCQFYTNTEEYFLMHWRSDEHYKVISKAPGKFWCFLCKFECNDNDEMENHLLGLDHKEVVFVINRSFPIVIFKRIEIVCNLCKATFQYNIELRKHSINCTQIPISTASDDYQSKHICKVCGEICKSRLSLQRHAKIKHGLKCFFCAICKLEFNTRTAASKHRNSSLHKNTADALHNKQNSSRKCPHCEMVLPNLLKLKEHINEKHSDSKYTCSLCNAKFPLPQDLGRHVRDRVCHPSTSKAHLEKSNSLQTTSKDVEKTKDDAMMGCTQCNFKSDLKAELIFHEILHSIKEPISVSTKIPCSLCKKEFRKHSLRFHLRQHTNEKLFDCKLCEMKFSRKQNLKTHIENIHVKKTFQKQQIKETPTEIIEKENLPEDACEICGKLFKRKYLKRHMSTHIARDKKHSCPVETCFYNAQFYSELCEHIENDHNVTEIKRFHCGIGKCEYKGKSQALLMRHRSMVHKPMTKKFKCTECKFYTKIPGHLKRHMRSHTGEKPFKCPHCDYACSTSEYLRKHVISTKQHPGKFLYECHLCEKFNAIEIFKTNYQRDYRAHLDIYHY